MVEISCSLTELSSHGLGDGWCYLAGDGQVWSRIDDNSGGGAFVLRVTARAHVLGCEVPVVD